MNLQIVCKRFYNKIIPTTIYYFKIKCNNTLYQFYSSTQRFVEYNLEEFSLTHKLIQETKEAFYLNHKCAIVNNDK